MKEVILTDYDIKSIDLKSRIFASGMVKQYCTALYGKAIANDAWVKWREWAGLTRRRRSFTFEQFCFVAAIATIRSMGGYNKRQLRESEILKQANSVELQNCIAEAIAYLDALGVVSGFDAVEELQRRGIETNRRALSRKVPGFSCYGVYKVTYLERMVS